MKLAERIYSRSPVWLQHALVSAHGWGLRHRRGSDSRIRHGFAFLAESQHWDEERFLAFQIEALRALLRGAFDHVPHYREVRQKLGCAAEDFKSVADLAQLPVLDKAEVRGREELFLDERVPRRDCTVIHTSGTSGTPLRVHESRESFSRRMAFVVRLRAWAGLADPFYPRRAQFTGREVAAGPAVAGASYWRRNAAGNALLFSTTHLSPDTVPDYAERLRRLEPELIDGYPSALAIIARLSLRMGLELPRPRAVIVTAETLFPEDRAEIEAAFGCPVFNQYAASEPSCFWSDCENGRLHVHPEYGISELLDARGAPAAVGTQGNVVVTSFLNSAMPLIRYRLGDLAVASPETSCACGRRMPRIESVVGRTDDVLYVPERGYIGRLDPVFKDLEGIVEAQIVQETLEDLRVRLVPGERYGERAERALLANLRAKIGDATRVRIETTPSIARGPNGKFPAVVTRVRHLYPAR